MLITSNCANALKLVDVVAIVLVLAVKLHPSETVMSALCDVSPTNVVLVCAIVVIYSVFFLLNLAVFGPNPYTAED